MRQIIITRQFEKDVKRVKKRGLELPKLKTVIATLAQDGSLEPRYKDHALRGNYTGFRECHLEPDWLLVYKIMPDSLELARTGTHSDLFK